jgi:hypothetical protein
VDDDDDDDDISRAWKSIRENLLLYLFVQRTIKLAVFIMGGYHCHQPDTKFYPSFFSKD